MLLFTVYDPAGVHAPMLLDFADPALESTDVYGDVAAKYPNTQYVFYRDMSTEEKRNRLTGQAVLTYLHWPTVHEVAARRHFRDISICLKTLSPLNAIFYMVSHMPDLCKCDITSCSSIVDIYEAVLQLSFTLQLASECYTRLLKFPVHGFYLPRVQLLLTQLERAAKHNKYLTDMGTAEAAIAVMGNWRDFMRDGAVQSYATYFQCEFIADAKKMIFGETEE